MANAGLCSTCGEEAGYRFCLDRFHDQDVPVVANLKRVLEMISRR